MSVCVLWLNDQVIRSQISDLRSQIPEQRSQIRDLGLDGCHLGLIDSGCRRWIRFLVDWRRQSLFRVTSISGKRPKRNHPAHQDEQEDDEQPRAEHDNVAPRALRWN